VPILAVFYSLFVGQDIDIGIYFIFTYFRSLSKFSCKAKKILFVGSRRPPAPGALRQLPHRASRSYATDSGGVKGSRLVDWSLTALSTQCRSYHAFKVRLY